MSLGGFQVRPARSEEADMLVAMIGAMALETEDRRLDAETLRAGVQAVFDHPALGTYYVITPASEAAANGGEQPSASELVDPIGCTMITREWSDWHNAPYWWVQSLYIRPGYRGRGLFHQLLAHLEAEACQAGVAEIRLYVERENARAIRAYEHAGFEAERYRCMTKVLSPARTSETACFQPS